MNDLLRTLLTQLKNSGASARWAMGACVGMALLITGFFVWQARNPHFVLLAADLDAQEFNSAVKALASADIDFDTSLGGAPYFIRVEESMQYDARAAVHLSGEFLGQSRGINSGLAGANSVFLGQTERLQRTQKRLWEETEMQLERINYVASATVTISGLQTSVLSGRRSDDRKASVVLSLRGLTLPTATQTRALVGIVRGATGVSERNITIVDQHSNIVFDGADSGGPDSILALEERFARTKTNSVQRQLDRAFGPGLAIVAVTGEWKQVQEESISEQLTPAKKPRTERTRTTEEPEWRRQMGGPAGVAANTQEGAGVVGMSLNQPALAKTSEEETSYAFGSTTTHTVAQAHQLQRLSISLVLDESIADKLDAAISLIKGMVAFDESRGDVIEPAITALPGLERDNEGVPLLPEPIQAPTPTSPVLTMALEYGLEIAAGLAFLFVLLRSLKSSSKSRSGQPREETVVETIVGPDGKRTVKRTRRAAPAIEEDDLDKVIDLDALARAHIEDLLQQEPEKVSKLLSRWALAEDVYAKSSSS